MTYRREHLEELRSGQFGMCSRRNSIGLRSIMPELRWTSRRPGTQRKGFLNKISKGRALLLALYYGQLESCLCARIL
jgi:hypothetical protein